ncbi:MAG: DUF3048 domain-containing protein [Clostridia bacterium]|nr:DUF3048 domain-containing protein [Clostridia bacterium]
MKKILALVMVLSILFLTGCKKDEPPVEESTTVTTTQTTTAKPEPKVYRNFLTGAERASEVTPRPVAVTVNNIGAALPQYGIAAADIIMEFPAEGGVSRLLALYSDYSNMPNVCSIRSCRYYFPIFAQGFGAVYFCYGSNETLGTPTLEKTGIDYIDGNKAGDSLVFERDSERLQYYAIEHTAYLKGENMNEIFEKYEFSKTLPDGFGETIFDFAEKEYSHIDKCAEITASFSSYYESRFTYDAEKGVYFKEHNGSAHIDGKTEEQLAFKNVIILETEPSLYKNTKLVAFDCTGGTGYYATNGTVMKITWSKEAAASPVMLYDENGTPIKINSGKSYIGVATSSVDIPVEEVTEAAAG